VTSDTMKRRVEHAKQMLEEQSRAMQAEWEKGKAWPSTLPGDRGAMSPLGGAMKQTEEKTKTQEAKPTTKPKFVW
jgi:hypothetical protein